MTATAPRPQPYAAVTAWEIGEQSAHKPLRRFGSASVERPVSAAIAEADAEDEQAKRPCGARLEPSTNGVSI